jgi:hypothetical protein
VHLLDIEPLDLGEDVRAIGLDLVEDDQDREPVRGQDAAQIWSRVLRATAGQEPWVLDFFSHIDRVCEFCDRHEIGYRKAASRSIVVPAPDAAHLTMLLERFQAETFGARAGGPIASGSDPDLEQGLARRGVDAYHAAFPKYFYCAICAFEDGSLVLLSEKLWASEVIRRVRPVIEGLTEVRLPT